MGGQGRLKINAFRFMGVCPYVIPAGPSCPFIECSPRMVRQQKVAEWEEERLAEVPRPTSGWIRSNYVVWDLKTKPVQLIMALLFTYHVLSLLYFITSSGFNALCKGQGFGSHSLEKTEAANSRRCASLINGVGGNDTFTEEGILCCDRSNVRTDVCLLRGDVRTDSPSSAIYLYGNRSSGEEKIRPYTRKWETSIMNTIDEISLESMNPDAARESNASACQIRHSVPGVVFSTGGYTGNLFHEFNDGILPLYITTQHLRGEVVLVILQYHNWWMTKYAEIVKQLSNYPVVDFSGDERVHCFAEMIVGLKIHGDLSVDPALMKGGKSIRDFRGMLSEGYAPRLRAMASSDSGSRLGSVDSAKPARPKLAIISRSDSRILLNENQIVALAQTIGFQVEIVAPKRTTELVEMYRALNSCDVMLGVHGAAMTHFLFMRPGTVLIQIVPLGIDWAAATYLGEPAIKLGLKYIEYKIAPEESSLYEKYEKTDAVLADPPSITRKGWSETKKVYLDDQNVRPILERLRKILVSAYSYVTTHRNFMGR